MKDNKTEIRMIPIEDLIPTYTEETNPNKMSPEKFAALVELIRDQGFLQSASVTPEKGSKKFKIFDGHHRYWAAQQVGLAEIPCVIKAKMSVHLAHAVGIGMNNARGELDISVTSAIMTDIMENTKWAASQLALLTAMPLEEVEALTSVTVVDSDEILEDIGEASDLSDLEGAQDLPSKPYVLEIQFKDKDTYKMARKKLKRAAGKGGDLALGLLTLLGEEVGSDG